MLNAHGLNSNGAMELYDDRPISMYDNLNNMTTNMNSINTNATTTTTPLLAIDSSTPKLSKAPTTPQPIVTITPTTSSKTNGAIHSTPFTDITFNFNDNNNITQQKQYQQQQQQQQQPYQQQHQQQLEINGNRNLNERIANTGNATAAAVYATPYKTTASVKPVIITTASPIPHLIVQQQQQQHSPILATTATTTTTDTSTTTVDTLTSSSPSLLHTKAIITPTAIAAATTTTISNATLNSDTLNNFDRPLSQHSQSELNDTTQSIAAVKAALNEAKSKFFGLNGYASAQEQQQQHQQNHSYDNNYDESLNEQLLPIEQQQQQQPQQQQVQNHKKPQPKYQNIPENSALFRNQSAESGGSGGSGGDTDPPPELSPKPVDYQNLQQPSYNRNIQTSTTPDHQRKMPSGTTAYNQISLNDIDSPASRSQVYRITTTICETNYHFILISMIIQSIEEF